MNWDAVGAIGEIIGAIAVVISIAYLSIQIRSNTRATKATAGFESTHSWAETNELVLNIEPEFKSTIMSSYSPEKTWNDFSASERFDLSLLHRSLFQKLEGQYFLFKYGFLDKDIWTQRSSWARSLIELPFYREWWEQEKYQHIYTVEFLEKVENSQLFEMKGAAGVDDGDT